MSYRSVYQVHRAASPLGTTGLSAVELSNHGLQVSTFCQVMTVTPMVARDEIIFTQDAADSDRNGFLPDTQMNRRLHLVEMVQGFYTQLDFANPQHLKVERQQCLPG
jgi:hypothetical protein